MRNIRSSIKIVIIILILIGLIGFFINYIFIGKLSYNIHLESSPNWIQCITSHVIRKEAISLPEIQTRGLWSIASGNIDLLLMIDSLNIKNVSKIKVMEMEKENEIDFNQTFPTVFKISKKSRNKPSKVILSIQEEIASVATSFPEKTYEKKSLPKYSEKIDEKKFPLCFRIDKNQLVTVYFINNEVGAVSNKSIPFEFMTSSPLSCYAGSPGQHLSSKSAKTVVLKYDNLQPKQMQNNRILINTREYVGIVYDSRLSVGNVDHTGNYSIVLSDLTHTTSVLLDSTENQFDLALTPKKKNDKLSWFILQGAAKYFLISGPKTSFSLGVNKYNLTSTDRLEIIGDYIFLLEFTPDSMPKLFLEGKANSCKINGIQVLPTRWSLVNPGIQGGLVGAIIGFLASLIIQVFSKRQSN